MLRHLCKFFLIGLASGELVAENWPAWRGPRGDGSSLEKQAPVHWNAMSNVIWKAEVHGVGHASPIIWENRVFVFTALTETEERQLLAYDTKDGKLLWRQTVLKAPLESKHAKNSHASSTHATDRKRVFASFLDGREMVVAAHDFSGNQQWLVRVGEFYSQFGFCSSPIISDNKLIVSADHERGAFITALDPKNGKTLWKTERRKGTRGYSTPLGVKVSGRNQIVLAGALSVRGYAARDGRELWHYDGPTDSFVATPVYSPTLKLLFVVGGYPEKVIVALNPTGNEKLDADSVKWRTNKGGAYVPSPVISGQYLLSISEAGVAHCFDAATGKLFLEERLGVQHASPVAAAGLVYFLNDEGVTHVVKAAPEFNLVAKNELGEPCYASPAVSRGRVFIRGGRQLFCIAGEN